MHAFVFSYRFMHASHKECIYCTYEQLFYGREAHVIGSHVYFFEFPPASAQIFELDAVAAIFKMLKIKLLIFSF